MSVNAYTSDRKRSRPITKRKKIDFFKKNKIATSFIIIIIIIITLAAVFVIYSEESDEADSEADTQDNGSSNGPGGNGEVTSNPIATIMTSMGNIKVELYEDLVPITAGNFIDHANSGYYDGVIFHRVIPNFMIQGGDPNGDGSGGHAANYYDGYGDSNNPDTWVIPDEFHKNLSNIRGTLSMANRGPDTGGSQFFINIVDNSYLDYNKDPLTSKHAVFGIVVDGMNVVDAISQVEKDETTNKPITDVVIYSIMIEE